MEDNFENGSCDDRDKINELNLVVKNIYEVAKENNFSTGVVSTSEVPKLKASVIGDDNFESTGWIDETDDNFGKTEETTIVQFTIVQCETRDDR